MRYEYFDRKENSKSYQFGYAVGVCLVGLVLILAVHTLRAWVLLSLWNWYITPYFVLPALGFLSAFGISLAALMLTPTLPNSDKEAKNYLTRAIGTPCASWLVGYLVYLISQG